MISLTYLIKRYYRIVFGSIILLYIFFSLTASYILYNVLLNNSLTVASFGDSYFRKASIDIENKVNISKDIFYDIEKLYRENILRKTTEIEEYIRKKYLEKYDVAIISEKGVIIETTNTNEINLDLCQFPDASKSLQETRNTKGLLIDYPVLNSDYKSLYIYLLRYIPEKKVYLQLGHKIMIFSELIKSLSILNLESNYHFDYSIYYVYLEKDYMNFKLYGGRGKIDREIVRDILSKPNRTLILKDFNDIKLYGTICQHKGFALIYLLHVKSLSQTFIVVWLTFNVILFLLAFLLYKKFIFIIREKIENPLKEIKNYVNDSKPFQYMGDIIEFKELADTYEYHLERTKTRDFLKEVLIAQERERERIARDVHDIIIQNLNYLLIKLKQKKDNELAEILKNQIQELRKMVIDSDIVIFKNLGLNKYFDIFIQDCASKNSNIRFYLKNSFDYFDNFNRDEQIHILRIVRELVTNAIKHAKCKLIELRFYKKDNLLCIEIIDDGVGFDINNIDTKNHFGLISVKERVFILSGQINIKSNASGTQVTIEVPIKNI